MSEQAPVLEFWFELASTYSYLAAMRVEQEAERAGVRVAYKPFLLGPVFARQGWNDSPFNIYEAKGRYMWRDMERYCSRYGFPFRKPSAFPRGSLMGARVAFAAAAAGEPWCGAFVRAIYTANFAADRDIADPNVVGALVAELGAPVATWIERAQTADVKDGLKAQTARAIEIGIFGAPTFVVRGGLRGGEGETGVELFWGNDRLEDALAWCTRT